MAKFVVSYTIDVDAENAMEAAKEVEKILNSQNFRPALIVVDQNKKSVLIDLEEENV